VVVDTHVTRLSQRLGWSKNTEPEKIERDLCAVLPRNEWDHASHVLIFHGRRCCFARKPDCGACSVNDACPAAFDAEHVGRKARRGGDDDEAPAPRAAAKALAKKVTERVRPAKAAKAKNATASKKAARPGAVKKRRREPVA
jgi:endonuclease-3